MGEIVQATATSEEVRQKIKNLEGLPPFPAIASQILMECEKPEVDIGVVAQLVECEPAISAKVIQLSNSPMFGASRPIVSINHAIVLLGFTSVSQMAVSIAAGAIFEQGDPKLAKHRKKTFRQSLACAITSRFLAGEVGTANPDEAFLSGVMHDVGKLVLFDTAPEQFCDILDQEKTGNTTVVEQEAFGTDHAEVGKRCGAKWGFPSQINRAIGLHHKDPSEISGDLSMAVMAGNYFSQQWSLADSPEFVQPKIAAIDELFADRDLAKIKDICVDQFESVIEICAG